MFCLDTLKEEEDVVTEEVKWKKESNLTPFDFIESITNGIGSIMLTDNDKKAYPPFLVNKGLSMGGDTLFYALEMNKFPSLDKELQYNYLRHSVKKGKRYNTWAKEVKEEDINNVMEYYNVNQRVASDYISLLTSDQISSINNKIKMSKGILVRS